jgi:hypothetical protein
VVDHGGPAPASSGAGAPGRPRARGWARWDRLDAGNLPVAAPPGSGRRSEAADEAERRRTEPRVAGTLQSTREGARRRLSTGGSPRVRGGWRRGRRRPAGAAAATASSAGLGEEGGEGGDFGPPPSIPLTGSFKQARRSQWRPQWSSGRRRTSGNRRWPELL